jgi:hypothetical protein
VPALRDHAGTIFPLQRYGIRRNMADFVKIQEIPVQNLRYQWKTSIFLSRKLSLCALQGWKWIIRFSFHGKCRSNRRTSNGAKISDHRCLNFMNWENG